ncbi:peptidoglycan amidohydrolase family protein [Anaerococcus sp. ENR1011]|uniref:Peptidoglycan amidohydrolase family protein n=1 Tax=Anaerococcus groningensis TaxID=3115616 RepID=A0ABW9N058_9FIRM
MQSVEKMLAYAKSKRRKVGYSMTYPQRLGPAYLDCSSFVYYALIAGGFLPQATVIGNTETLYKLKGTVLEEIYSYEQIQAGDIFIRGIEGRSAGASGHTGIFLEKGKIIHCNAVNGTVSINGEENFLRYFLSCKRSNYERYFRPVIKNQSPQKHKTGIAKVHASTYVRSAPSTQAAIVASYHKGDKINYDSIVIANGYHWLSYIGNTSGQRRYVAYKDSKGRQWMDI